MSSDRKKTLISAVGRASQAYQESVDRFDQAAADRLGLHRTDLRCLGVIFERQPISVSEIGKMVDLTRGATTTALDRVEHAGLVRRIRHPNDRRSVLLEVTEIGQQAAAAIWGPMVMAGEVVLDRYTVEELKVVLRFLEEARQVQLQHLAISGE